MHRRTLGRSHTELVDLGYEQVYDFGGITSWPYDTVSGADTSQAKAPWRTTSFRGREGVRQDARRARRRHGGLIARSAR